MLFLHLEHSGEMVVNEGRASGEVVKCRPSAQWSALGTDLCVSTGFKAVKSTEHTLSL